MAQLDAAVQRAADEARVIAREEIRQELEAERRLRIEAEAKAATATNDAVGDVEMKFERDPRTGKIISPVRLSGSVGDYEMTFDRGKDGRISRATLKPRNG